MDNIRELPIGIQDFQKLRKGNFVYVDKTDYIYTLAHSKLPYFLSRPRRFGKSLFLSTLRYYFEGKKELFEGLKIADMEKDNPDAWQEYQVLYVDFNSDEYKSASSIENVLNIHLVQWEKKYGLEPGNFSLAGRFENVILTAYEQSGKGVVVLVDEYDKPLLESGDEEQNEHNRTVFKGFFSLLKKLDRCIEFVFITGVTKFSKVSIFSDLNQLNDISLDNEFCTICGITETELKSDFEPYIINLASAQGYSKEECLDDLKRLYDGYHFSIDCIGVYNPFSLLNALKKKNLDMYWFSTGTPTFLIEKIKSSGFDPKIITDGELYADAQVLTDYRYDNPDPVSLFYQSGYLTIKGYDNKYRSYELGYPNEEVKYGFINSLAQYYLSNEQSPKPLDIRLFVRDLRTGNTDSLRDRFVALFSNIPYPADENTLEETFRNIFYTVFLLLGQFSKSEPHFSKGRADCIVETDNYVYIFEFKRDKSAKEALQQIEDKGYASVYLADPRRIIKIGVNFSSKERTITEWLVL